jgi:hypothetical protein
MKYRILIALVMILISPCRLFAEDLKGEVLLVKKQKKKTPAIGIDVTIKESGDSGKTKAAGLFRIFLSRQLKGKGSVSLSVNKPEWVIQYPLDGETPIPTNLDMLVHVYLLPKGSKKLWTDDRFEKFIRDIAEKAKSQVKPEAPQGQKASIDFGRYVKDWAVQYGFTPQQAKLEIDRWVEEVENNQEDFYRVGLAEYYKKNFHKAYELANESGERNAKAYAQKSNEAENHRHQALRDYQLAGDAAYYDYQFSAALAAYTHAVQYASKEKEPQVWATRKNSVGTANWAIGIRIEGALAHKHLREAVAAYREALTVYT